MKRFTTLLFITFSIFPLNINAANISTPLPGKCIAFKPEALYSSILYTDVAKNIANSKDYGQRSTSRSKEFWVVYSDRSNNTTYTAPGSTTPYKKLDFNEKVKIAQIDKGYALVYSEPKEQGVFPNISSMAEWKGWIPMSHLLLWDTCTANRAGIYEKAMLCANIDEDLSDNQLGKLFKNPERSNEFEKLSISFRYYFVMKREGKKALLATQNTMNGDSYKVLYGWVHENSFVDWNQRSCLEPTWDIEDVEYFAKNGTKVNIYEDKACKKKASYITFAKKNSDDFDPDMYRMDGSTLRYPILDDSKGSMWNCTTFSSTGKSGAINAGTTEKKSGLNIFKKNLDELSNIKIAIVIDGTKSMERFYPAVASAVREFTNFFQKTDDVKVGVVIYRDKQDGEYATEVFPMTDPANPSLAAFLNSGGKYGIKSSPKDKSLEEALYFGIDKALDSFNFKPEESNMLFVIGDCGNSSDYPAITKETLTRKLIDKNVTLMGFQVRNDSSNQAFTIFNNNVTTLIKESLQGKFDKLCQDGGKKVIVKAQLKKNAYEFTNNAASLENSLYVGTHKYVQSGIMDLDELINQLNGSVTTVKTTIEHAKDVLVTGENGISGINSFSGNTEISGPELDMEWLAQRVGKDVVKELQNSNTTVSFKGYTQKKDKASDREYYKSVIFISQQELNTLMQRLSPLYEVSQRKGDDRTPYATAMKALIQSMIPGITDEEMNAMGVDEIMSIISGLNAHTRTTRGHTLPEIMSRQAVNPTEYQTIIGKFARQYRKLQAIQKRPYPFAPEFNGAKYYWIPTEDLP